MAEATFYQLSEAFDSEAKQLHAVCRVIHKIYQVSTRAAVLCDTPQRAKALDDLLWTFNQGSFVPHGLAPCREPICIGTETHELRDYAILILLVEKLPAHLEDFARLVDFIMPAPDQLKAARQRYKMLKERQLTLTVHPLSPT